MRFPDYIYEGVRRVTFKGGATFVPVCPTCGRFVKADSEIQLNGFGGLIDEPNGTCKHCGRIQMLFEGFI